MTKISLLLNVSWKRRCALVILLAAAGLLACHSYGFDVTIQNNARVPLRNVELDYPGAAFGTGLIQPGASYWYHIKPNANGELTLSFQKEDGGTFRQKGLDVRRGESGRLVVIVDQDANQQWHMRVEQK